MNTDDLIVNSLDCVLPVFCYLNIHPNFITLAALVLSALIPYFHINKQYKYVIACIIIRQLCDILDGAVARKCKKTSKLGGYLDTLADTIFLYSSLFLLLSFFYKDIKYVCTLSVILTLFIIYIFVQFFDINILHNHTKLKNNYNTSDIITLLKNLIVIVTNNSMFTLIILIMLYLKYL